MDRWSRSTILGARGKFVDDAHAIRVKLQTDYFYLPTGGFEGGNHEVRLQAQVYY